MSTDEGGLTGLILVCALVTFLTRVGGHLVLTRFTPLHPRLEAALEAVPIAVLGALIAPSFLLGGPAEITAGVVAGIAGLRLSATWILVIGLATLVGLRQLGL